MKQRLRMKMASCLCLFVAAFAAVLFVNGDNTVSAASNPAFEDSFESGDLTSASSAEAPKGSE
ncbi:hypothetical protein [Paenibacillus sp. HB172176]|uniref:hypothetical protein n=1 Tax=Paenibacillus sp. HB172176 TaxID=2493690 RepID=UPI001438D2AE|nr:hypothetical protein [Paenibacillus sp. HB172176]